MLKKFISNFELVISSALIYLLIIVSTASVLGRYLLPTPISWSEELSRYFFMWLAMFSFPYAVASGSQLCVDLIPNTLLKGYPKIQLALRIFCNVGTFIFLFMLCKVGLEACLTTKEIAPASKIPMKIVYSCIPLGSILGMIRLVLDCIKGILGKDEKTEGPTSVLS